MPTSFITAPGCSGGATWDSVALHQWTRSRSPRIGAMLGGGPTCFARLRQRKLAQPAGKLSLCISRCDVDIKTQCPRKAAATYRGLYPAL